MQDEQWFFVDIRYDVLSRVFDQGPIMLIAYWIAIVPSNRCLLFACVVQISYDCAACCMGTADPPNFIAKSKKLPPSRTIDNTQYVYNSY